MLRLENMLALKAWKLQSIVNTYSSFTGNGGTGRHNENKKDTFKNMLQEIKRKPSLKINKFRKSPAPPAITIIKLQANYLYQRTLS